MWKQPDQSFKLMRPVMYVTWKIVFCLVHFFILNSVLCHLLTNRIYYNDFISRLTRRLINCKCGKTPQGNQEHPRKTRTTTNNNRRFWQHFIIYSYGTFLHAKWRTWWGSHLLLDFQRPWAWSKNIERLVTASTCLWWANWWNISLRKATAWNRQRRSGNWAIPSKTTPCFLFVILYYHCIFSLQPKRGESVAMCLYMDGLTLIYFFLGKMQWRRSKDILLERRGGWNIPKISSSIFEMGHACPTCSNCHFFLVIDS